MAYISDTLTHWAGTKYKKNTKKYEILTRNILRKKELRFGKCPLSVKSKYWGDDINREMISFTDIPLSECESHCRKYSKFGISFEKAYLANLYATPVAYSQNPACDGNIDYIFRTLLRLNEILIKKTGTPEFDLIDLPKKEKDHTIHKNTLPLLKYLLTYYEKYDKDNNFKYTKGSKSKKLSQKQIAFFKNQKAGYFEREWRIIPSSLSKQNLSDIIIPKKDGYKYFKFEEKYIKFVIMPKEFISKFKKESRDIFSKYNKENIPIVLAYEDLKYI